MTHRYSKAFARGFIFGLALPVLFIMFLLGDKNALKFNFYEGLEDGKRNT